MEQIEKQLTQFKKNIENAKKEQAESDGRIAEMESRLQKDYEVSSVDEGIELLEKMRTKLASLEEKIVTDFASLQKSVAEASK